MVKIAKAIMIIILLAFQLSYGQGYRPKTIQWKVIDRKISEDFLNVYKRVNCDIVLYVHYPERHTENGSDQRYLVEYFPAENHHGIFRRHVIVR